MKSFAIIFTTVLLHSISGLAAEEAVNKKTGEVVPELITIEKPLSVPQKTETDEADQLITNRRLRADSGSLSLWSVSTSFNYQGGSLSDPKDAKRPNIVKGADALTLQNLTGDVGVRYRVTKLLSLTGSTGVFMTTPFHDSIKTDNKKLQKQFDENHQKLTINDPVLKLTYVNRFFDVQSVSNAKLTLITNNQQKLDGYQWSYYVSQNVMKQVAGTKFSFGGNVALQLYSFSRQNDALTDSVVGVYPSMEYEINKTLNFRAVLGQWVYQHIRAEDSWTYEKRKVYNSLGLGILLGRDVFLYPNIQYIPSDIRSDRTNIALSTNINFF
jgi:hypothetical protein